MHQFSNTMYCVDWAEDIFDDARNEMTKLKASNNTT